LFYLNHGITGIFQEGAYQSYGSDLGPMKNYLMSKLLWDPINSNSTQIMKEFFTLYYGNHVGLKLQEYVKLWSKSIQANHFFLGESVPYTSQYLTPSNLLKSATFTLPDTTTTKIQAKRLRIASLTTMYVILLRWEEIQLYSKNNGITWPYNDTTKLDCFNTFSNIFLNDAKATLLSEGGAHDLRWFKKMLKL
jgi:hypothetical protein